LVVPKKETYISESNATSSRGEILEPQGPKLMWTMSVRFESRYLHVLHFDFELFALSQWHVLSKIERACNPWITRITGKEWPYL